MMKFFIFLCVLVSAATINSMDCLKHCFKKKKKKPVVIAMVSPPSVEQLARNTILFKEVTSGLPNMVQLAIMANADVHAIDPTDNNRALYKAASLAVSTHSKGAKTSGPYVE